MPHGSSVAAVSTARPSHHASAIRPRLRGIATPTVNGGPAKGTAITADEEDRRWAAGPPAAARFTAGRANRTLVAARARRIKPSWLRAYPRRQLSGCAVDGRVNRTLVLARAPPSRAQWLCGRRPGEQNPRGCEGLANKTVMAAGGRPSTAQRLRGRRPGEQNPRACEGPAVEGPVAVRSTAGRTEPSWLRGPRRRRPSGYAVDGRASRTVGPGATQIRPSPAVGARGHATVFGRGRDLRDRSVTRWSIVVWGKRRVQLSCPSCGWPGCFSRS